MIMHKAFELFVSVFFFFSPIFIEKDLKRLVFLDIIRKSLQKKIFKMIFKR